LRRAASTSLQCATATLAAHPVENRARPLRRLAWLAVLSTAILFAAVVVPALVAGQASEDPLIVRQRELRDLKGKIEDNRRKIDQLRKKEKEMGALSAGLARDRDLTTRYLSQLEEQEHALLGDLSDRQTELDQRTEDESRATLLLRQRLRLYQRSRRLNTAEILLSSRNFAELFARGAILSREIQRDRADLIRLQQVRQDVALATALLESRRNGLESLQEEKLREKARIEERSDQAQTEIVRLRRERETFEDRQKDLAKTEGQIRGLIAKLETARQNPPRAGQSVTPGGPGPGGGKGHLAWPVRGKLITHFGFEMHPRFGTRVPSNGIDIAAPLGATITAVAAGTAEFVDWLSGYGRCVILNHGGGFYTLYAHCSRVLVAKGQKVATGQTIAEVGDTDSVKGPCLHFEIRRGQEAMDPEAWLQ
jgi:septal ring factor EnvC (AmiA/AmiB activator)